MAVTKLSDISNNVQKFWSPLFVDELRENSVLPSLVMRDYQGDLKRGR